MAGFWNSQFKLPATTTQRWFDVSFGMAAPLVCLYFDPTVFRSGGAGDTGLLVPFRIFGYAEIALSIASGLFSAYAAGLLGVEWALVGQRDFLRLTRHRHVAADNGGVGGVDRNSWIRPIYHWIYLCA